MMKTKLMGLLLVAGGSLFAQTRFAVGVQFGAPGYYQAAPAAPVRVGVTDYRPPCPGPGYVWVDGYYDGYGNWYNGYWALPPYAGAYWVAPRLSGGHFFAGYWGGGARAIGRDDYRFRESREHEWREHEWREHEWREHEWRDHDHDGDRRGDFGRGFRR
jgi:hypothetical protein